MKRLLLICISLFFLAQASCQVKELITLNPTSSMIYDNIILKGRGGVDPSSIKVILREGEQAILPFATICSLNSGMIDKDTLMKADSLICSGKNYEIISFTMFGRGEELKSLSKFLTAGMKKCISEMRSGNKLSFFDIKARTPDGKISSLSPIILKLK